MTIKGFFRRIKERKIAHARLLRGEMDHVMTAHHYQAVHETFDLYQQNNWLVDDLPLIQKITAGKICEIGCGNGRFLNAAVGHFAEITGMDWAQSPLLVVLPDTVQFVQQDLSAGFPPGKAYDLICSADFLEHLTIDAIKGLIAQMLPQATYHYHKIACYDDGGSHLTILSPREWLRLFKVHDPRFYIHRVTDRRNNGQDVVVVTNYPNLPRA